MSDTHARTSRLLSLLPEPLRRRLGPADDTLTEAPGDGTDFLFQSEVGRSSRKSNARLLMSRLVPKLPEPLLKSLVRSGSKGLSRADVDAIFHFQSEVEKLPTVQKGMRALGMKSLMEWNLDRDRIVRTRSPYTHPMMRPLFYYPGITARMRHDPAAFDWVPRLEAAYPVIKAELLRALEQNQGFQPFVAGEKDKERWLIKSDEGVVYASDRDAPSMWNIMYLYMGGPVAESQALCPRTVEILESIPRFNRRAPSVFSALHPGSHIAPHHGPRNGVLRVHLPLIVPGRCHLNVGSELFEWQDGKVEIWDDSFSHQAWNQSDRTRIVLHFDIYHPDWTDEDVERLDELDRLFDSTAVMSIFHDIRRQTKDLLNGKQWLVR